MAEPLADELSLENACRGMLEGNGDLKFRIDLAVEFIRRNYRLYPVAIGKAIEVLEAVAKQAEDNAARGWCVYYRSWTWVDQGRFEEGAAGFVAARGHFEQAFFNRGIARSYMSEGYCYIARGRMGEAFSRLRQAMELAGDSGDDETLALALGNVSELYFELDQYREALDTLKKMLALFGSDDNNRLLMLERIGHCHHLIGEEESAREYLGQSLDLAERFGTTKAHPSLLMSLGAVSRVQGDLAAAKRHLEEAREGALALDAPVTVAQVDLELGRVYMTEGAYAQAAKAFASTIAGAKAINYPSIQIAAHRELAAANEKLGETAEAFANLKRHLDLLEERQTELMRQRMDLAQSEIASVELSHYRKMYRHIAGISAIGCEIASSLDLATTVATIYENVKSLIDANVFGIGLYDEDRRELDYRFFVEEGKPVEPFVQTLDEKRSLAAWCVTNRREIVIRNADAEYTKYVERIVLTGDSDTVPQSIIYLPLILSQKVVGVVTAQCYEKNAFGDFQVETLKTLASFIAISLENGRLYERVKAMAATDGLTGVANRAHFNTAAEMEFAKFKRYGQTLSSIMVDLDHFKSINDRYGHESGDLVLKAVAACAAKTVRNVDLLARYGGEEFVLLLPMTASEGARLLAERIRIAIEALAIEIRGGERIAVTASLGVAEALPTDVNYEDLVSRADAALYEAKHGGRNRVAVAGA